MKVHALVLGGILAVSAPALHAGCCALHDAEASQSGAPAVGEYRITSREDITDAAGQLLTRYTAQLNAGLKGGAPAQIEFRTPGGHRGNVTAFSSLALDLAEGSDYILHLRKDAAEQWEPVPFATKANRGTIEEKKALRKYFREGAHGRMPVAKSLLGSDKVEGNSGVPGSGATATGYKEVGGYPARYTTCDGGLPIPYLVDIDASKLPPGMTTQGALDAVAEALASWSAVSSLKFRYAGTQSFGASPDSFPNATDRTLRIQLHDSYNKLTAPVLGTGGGYLTNSATMRQGGRLGTQEFQEYLNGFVILEHDSTFLDNIANFKQALTHELGHALGLAHSSDNANESNPVLKNATMYWAAAQDGRGTTLTAYDKDRIAFGYPVTNTPPYLPDRFINAVSDGSSTPGLDLPNAADLNRIVVRGFDLQGDTQSGAALLGATDLAKWALTNGELIYTPTASISGAQKSDADIAIGGFYSTAYVQVSDGINLSRVARVGVIKITSDLKPTDGLPNSWMTTYFGNTNPAPEPLEDQPRAPRDPLSDPDSDGLNNRQEYNLGTNPVDPGSPAVWLSYNPTQSKLTFTPMRYVALQLQETSDFITWTTRGVYTTISAPEPITLDATPPSIDSKLKAYRAIPLP